MALRHVLLLGAGGFALSLVAALVGIGGAFYVGILYLLDPIWGED